jgi:hypothetical protein
MVRKSPTGMALSERLLERGHSRRLHAGGCALGLLVTAPRVVVEGQHQVVAAAAVRACLAPTPQPRNVHLMPEARPAAALHEVARGAKYVDAGFCGGGGRGGHCGDLFLGCAALYTPSISLYREKINSLDGYNLRLWWLLRGRFGQGAVGCCGGVRGSPPLWCTLVACGDYSSDERRVSLIPKYRTSTCSAWHDRNSPQLGP